MPTDQSARDQPGEARAFARLAEGHDRQADDPEALIASGNLPEIE